MAIAADSQFWFYLQETQQVGPLPWNQLCDLAANGTLRPSDSIRSEDSSEWTSAGLVAGLFPISNTIGLPPAVPRETEPVLSLDSPPASERNGTVLNDAPPWEGVVVTQFQGTNSTLHLSSSGTHLPTIPGYKLLGELGRGGMGVVYKAQHLQLNRVVALKMVLGGSVAGYGQLERFRAEAEAVARLQHANIVQIYEVGEHDNLPFFSLEYCEGGALDRKLAGTPLPPRESAELAETLARAMFVAHQRNIVHRDLKPANVLLAADGSPRITDFGLAKKLDDTAMQTQTGAVMGTPSYMPPEQALGKTRELGPAVDIYALGAMLYELLTGRPPFKGATPMDTLLQVTTDEPVPPSRLQPKLPRDLETICLKCLEKSPLRRYPTAQALADDLRRYLNGEPVQARPANWVERSWKWARRKPSVAGLVAVVVLAVATMLAGVAWFTLELSQERNNAIEAKNRAEQEREKTEDQRKLAEASEFEARKQEAEAKRQEAEAKRQEVETRRQEQKTDQEKKLADRRLEQARLSLVTASVWRAAGVWEREPMQALQLLDDENTCPKVLRDFAWGYYHNLAQRWKPKILTGKFAMVQSMAVAADGKTVATGTLDGQILLWNITTTEEPVILKGHTGTVNGVALHPKEPLLASAGEDGTLRLWDLNKKTGTILATYKVGNALGQAHGVAFSPDGSRLVCGVGRLHRDWPANDSDFRERDGEVWLYTVADRKREKVLFRLDAAILSIAWSPDGRTIAAGTAHDSAVRLINVANGSDVRMHPDPGWVYNVAFSPDGKRVAWCTAQQKAYIADTTTHKIDRLSGHQTDIFALAWSPDSQQLATGDYTGQIKVWNPTTGRERLALRGEPVARLAFVQNGNALVGGHAGKLSISPLTVNTSNSPLSSDSGFAAACLALDDTVLAAAPRNERQVRLWDFGKRKATTLSLDSGEANVLTASPDGKILAVGIQAFQITGARVVELKNEGECQLWDPGTGRRIATLKGTGQAVTSLVFIPQSQNLLVGDRTGKISLWDTEKPGDKAIVVISGQSNPVLAIAITPDGKTLAIADGKEIRLRDLQEARELTTLKGHTGVVKGLAFVNGGRSLASAGLDRSVRFWDPIEGKQIANLPGQPGAVMGLAVSPDGQTLALACSDRTVKLWDYRSRQLRAVLSGHNREGSAVAFSANGKIMVSTSAYAGAGWIQGGDLKVWRSD